MYNFSRSANAALNLTTPVEHAVAPLDDDDLLARVAPTAAHEVAAVHPQRGVVALPAVGALDAELGVALAEGRRRLVVHQVLGARRLVLRVVGAQLEAVSEKKEKEFRNNFCDIKFHVRYNQEFRCAVDRLTAFQIVLTAH